MAKTRTTIKMVKNLTADEFEQCYEKNFGINGSMQDDLMYLVEHPNDSKVVLIKQGTNIIAWALVQFDFSASGANAYFWVEPEYRGRGFGARLLYHTKKLDDKPYVFPHDSTSGKFFRKHLQDIRFGKHDAYWLTHSE